MTLLDGVNTFGEVRKAALAQVEATNDEAEASHAANQIALKWLETRKAAIDSLEDHSTAQDLVNESIEYGLSAEGRAEAETRQHNDTVRRATEEARARADALDEVRRAQDDVTDSVMRSLGGDIAYRESVRRTDEALYALVQTQANGESTASEMQVAVDNAAEAMLGQAEAAAQLAQDQAEANGKTQTAGERAVIMRNELQRLADTLLPGSPLRAQLQGYIDQLNSAPSTIATEVTTYYRTIGSPSAPTVQPTSGPRASGGSTMAGFTNQVAENGPELWSDGAATYMVSDRDGMVTPLSRGGVGGGITLNVYANQFTDGNLVGREIMSALDEYMRNGGQLPPSMQRRLSGGR